MYCVKLHLEIALFFSDIFVSPVAFYCLNSNLFHKSNSVVGGITELNDNNIDEQIAAPSIPQSWVI